MEVKPLTDLVDMDNNAATDWIIENQYDYVLIKNSNLVENRVSQAVSQAMPEPNVLSEFIIINETKIEVTPFEMLKLLVIAFPKDGTYEGKLTQGHWDKIEVWLNNLIKRAKSEA